VHAFHDHLSAELARFGARIDGFYACFHHAEAAEERWRHPDHPDRKPNPGMLLRAAADLGVDLARSAMIGDRESDMEAARRAECGAALHGWGPAGDGQGRARRSTGRRARRLSGFQTR
jgi:histidinol phosphatase-like enzyme